MSESEIKPALTPEEWAKQVTGAATNKRMGESEIALGVYAYLRTGPQADHMRANNAMLEDAGEPLLAVQWDTVDEIMGIHARHRLAALCLYQQSFGFTREDVEELDDLAKSWDEEAEISEKHMNGDAWQMGDPEDEGRGIWRKNAESCRRRAAKARSISNRINALLPPDSRGESSRTTT